MDSVLSIPDLNSSPRVLSSRASGQHRYRTKHCNLPRKVKKKRKIRKVPAEKDLEREEIDLDQDEEFMRARLRRIDYYNELENYELRVENVYVV